MSVFSFDFISLDCYNQGANSYYLTVYLWCVLPIAVAILIFVLALPRMAVAGGGVHGRKRVLNQHVSMFLLLTFMVLPPVSNKQLKIFDCIPLNGKQIYIRDNTAIDCRSSSYINFRAYVILFLLIYQTIPLIWLYMLSQNKTALNPSSTHHDETLSLYIRDNNPDLHYIQFLFYDYKCNRWWFEVIDMYRRIIFIGVLPLVSPRPSVRASFGIVLAVMSVALFNEEKPYRLKVFSTNCSLFFSVCLLFFFIL